MASPALIAAALAVLSPLGPETPMAIAAGITQGSLKALRTKDASYFEKHIAPDFVYISLKGQRQTKAAAVAGMKGSFQAIRGIPKASSRVVSARRAEGGIVFVEEQSITAKVGDGPKLSTIESKTRTEDLFVLKGGVWMAKRIKVLSDSTVIDGKPMPM